MASTMYMLMDGIKGESTDSTHKDWIEVTAFTHSITVPIISGIEGGKSTGRAQETFTISKLMDSSSPQLYDACANGRHFRTVQVDFLRAGDAFVKYLSVQMEDFLLSAITSTTDPDGPPTDRLSLVYGKIVWTPVRNPLLDAVRRQVTPINLKVP